MAVGAFVIGLSQIFSFSFFILTGDTCMYGYSTGVVCACGYM